MITVYQHDASGYYMYPFSYPGGPLPANCVVEAPQEQKGYIPRWTGAAWQQVENHKDEDGYLYGKPHTITDYGPYPEGWSATPPPPTLEEAKTSKLAEIRAAFAAAEASGHLSSSLGFEIDANERANRDMEGLITMMTATGQSSTLFCDYHNIMREVTLDNVKTMRLEIIAYGQVLYAKKWTLRAAVEAAQTVEEVEAVKWDAA